MRQALLFAILLTCSSCDDATQFSVTAYVETDPVASQGDAADDIAIWIHPDDPAMSVIIATNKREDSKGGLYVYGIDGKVVSSVTGKSMNNVDGRYGFELDGRKVDLFAATNRTNSSTEFFTIDPHTRQLRQVGMIPMGLTFSSIDFGNPYGIALSIDRATNQFYVFVSDGLGHVVQYLLVAKGNRVTGKLVRLWAEDSTVEGMVADDIGGHIFIGEESAGVYRYKMVPDKPDASGKPTTPPADRQVVDTTRGHLTRDVEGLALYETAGGGGYLIVSSQGNNRFVIYDRTTLTYVATFSIGDNKENNIDGVSHTDGIEAVSGNFGVMFPSGVFIAQDDDNGKSGQNFKLVSWREIMEKAGAKAITLTGDDAFDPRKR